MQQQDTLDSINIKHTPQYRAISHKPIQIGNHIIGYDQPAFIIAEIGINHNGNLNHAFKLIDIAIEAGCNAVKFQKRTVPIVYTETELQMPREVHESILMAGLDRNIFISEVKNRLVESNLQNSTNGDLKWALEFTRQEYAEIDAYAKHKGILWSVSPWDEQAVDDIVDFDLPFIKIASASLTDDGLLRKIRELSAPVILSTGMSTMEEVNHAVQLLGEENLILLHTVSTYPAREEELNFRVMETLRSTFPSIPIGYSGHEQGTTLSICARAFGACVIERHITIDRTLPGSDQAASLEPDGIKRVVSNIRRFEQALGSAEKVLLDREAPIKAKLRRK